MCNDFSNRGPLALPAYSYILISFMDVSFISVTQFLNIGLPLNLVLSHLACLFPHSINYSYGFNNSNVLNFISLPIIVCLSSVL